MKRRTNTVAGRQQIWSPWLPFPDPRKGQFVRAPIGPGGYELRRRDDGQRLVLVGLGKSVAYRLASLLPSPYGQGTRNNSEKRLYVLENLPKLQYRCCATASRKWAQKLERRLQKKSEYLFRT